MGARVAVARPGEIENIARNAVMLRIVTGSDLARDRRGDSEAGLLHPQWRKDVRAHVILERLPARVTHRLRKEAEAQVRVEILLARRIHDHPIAADDQVTRHRLLPFRVEVIVDGQSGGVAEHSAHGCG